jgi:hypothetical protein
MLAIQGNGAIVLGRIQTEPGTIVLKPLSCRDSPHEINFQDS